MPIYEYQCSSCGHELEVMQKMSDNPIKDCPECHKPTLNKLISASGFQLKGTGWYVTDYSAKGKSKLAQESSGNKAANTNTNADSKSTETKSTDAKTTEKKTTDKGSSSNSEAGNS